MIKKRSHKILLNLEIRKKKTNTYKPGGGEGGLLDFFLFSKFLKFFIESFFIFLNILLHII